MNIHWIEHVEFEGLGCIGPWLEENGYTLSCSRLWADDKLPAPEMIDGLIVMGGPMGIDDEEQYAWLAAEKVFIGEVVDRNRPVLGICLGAQLLANQLGAEVRVGEQKEIGFFPLTGSGGWLPAEFVAFHWHGDTFSVPEGAVRLASSEVTENQAFLYRNHVLALQFHLETTRESLVRLYEHSEDEIIDAPFIQPLKLAMEPLVDENLLANCNLLMGTLLERLFGKSVD